MAFFWEWLRFVPLVLVLGSGSLVWLLVALGKRGWTTGFAWLGSVVGFE